MAPTVQACGGGDASPVFMGAGDDGGTVGSPTTTGGSAASSTQDPAHPLSYLPVYDSGDGLHPSHEGKQAMAQAVKLTLFQ